MMNPKRRFKKADGTIFADWKNVPFANIFQEYNVKNTACLPQYTAGKYGLKPIDNEKIRYNIQNHKAFSINSLILGIGIEEVGVATNYPGCVSPIYTTYQIQDHKANSLFIAYYIKNVFAKNKGRITHKSTRREYEFEPTELKKIDIPLPDSLEEQEKIANFLFEIDNLIASAEAEIEKTKNFKKAMLQKMFPKDGESVPEIRFPGFTDDWEQRKVSEITKFHKQGFYTTEDYNESKKYYLLRGTDLTENKLILKDTPKIDATEKDYQAFKTEVGDFLIVRSGTVGTYGIVYEDIPAIFGSYLIDFRFDMEQVTNEFFGYFYQSESFKTQLRQIVQQSANTNINAENIKSTSIMLPSIDEQKRIGEYLGQIDNLITLHQRELDELNQFKKGMLQQMFV